MAENPDAPLIRMGIGDVTLPIAPVCVEAMKKGADEMGVKETFRGYEDSGSGYDFLKDTIGLTDRDIPERSNCRILQEVWRFSGTG